MHRLMFNRSRWCVKERRVLVFAGYPVIAVSLAGVSIRFSQITAVMQSLVGHQLSPAAQISVTRTCTPVGPAHLVVLRRIRVVPLPRAVTFGDALSSFTMVVNNAVHLCECYRKRVEVSALIWCVPLCACVCALLWSTCSAFHRACITPTV